MLVYLDESGDIGWNFTAAYRSGGSSRYLCLCFLIIPKSIKKKTEHIIIDLYSKYKWKSEKKSASASDLQKKEFAINAAQLCRDFPDIKIDCIVAKKENVQPHIRSDGNKLYNYMCRLVVVERMAGGDDFDFIPDKRSIKVESGNSLSDYLQTAIWFDAGSKTVMKNKPGESHKIFNLQFTDWVAHCVWRHFEDKQSDAFNILDRVIRVRRLYF